MRAQFFSFILAGLLSHAQARALDAAGNALEFYSEADFEGTMTSVPIKGIGACEPTKDNIIPDADISPPPANIPTTANVTSVKLPANKDLYPCCLLYRTACPSNPPKGYAQNLRSLTQHLEEDAADLTPTGFVRNGVKSYICPSADLCHSLVSGVTISNGKELMTNWWLTVTDLPDRKLPNGDSDMVMEILGQI